MDDIAKTLAAPLDHSFAILLILVGLYSISINAKFETGRYYLRSAKFARVAGLGYIIAGAGLLILR